MLRKSGIIFVMLIVVAALVMASASAASVKDGPNGKIKSGSGGYVFTVGQNSVSGTIMPMSISGGITQGQTKWASMTVSCYCTSFPIELYWGNPSNSLRMRIYTPDGYVSPAFYDNWDGILNGDIPVTVKRDGGVAQGTYYIEIYGDKVSGTQSFTVS